MRYVYETYNKKQKAAINRQIVVANLFYIGALAMCGIAVKQARKLGFLDGIRAVDISLHEVGLDEEYQKRCIERDGMSRC